jgi:hypothetical protein
MVKRSLVLFLLFLLPLHALDSGSPVPETILVEGSAASDYDLFGINLRGLSFAQARERILSDKIYEGRLNPYCPLGFGTRKIKHPFGIDAQVRVILNADVTAQERESLWYLFLK